MTQPLTENGQRLEAMVETYITGHFSDLPEAGCEITWDSGACSRPATHIILGHCTKEHEYQNSRICAECLGKAIMLGFLKEQGGAVCECGAKPLIKSVRPI